jgi:hypothetical protein
MIVILKESFGRFVRAGWFEGIMVMMQVTVMTVNFWEHVHGCDVK